MAPTFDDKAEEVIDILDNPEAVAGFIFSAHDGEGNTVAISGRQPPVGDFDYTLLLGAEINRISKATGLHPEDITNEALDRSRELDESGTISW